MSVVDDVAEFVKVLFHKKFQEGNDSLCLGCTGQIKADLG